MGRIDELMEQFMNEAFEQFKDREGQIYYGFSVSVGPDGKPIVNEFGNIKPNDKGPVLKEEIEPTLMSLRARALSRSAPSSPE